jgi:hypothetical protein
MNPWVEGARKGIYMAHATFGFPAGIILVLLGHNLGWLMVLAGMLGWWGWARDFGLRGHDG